MSWGVVLDRDGTLVRNAHHPTRPQQLRPYPNTVGALQRLQRAGAKLTVVSNQSAVARGLLTPDGLDRMDARLRELVAPARLVDTFYCPHHPDFSGPCACRKPGPKLVRRALRAMGTPPARAVLIGDSLSDMQAGRAAGVVTVLVLTGNGRRDRRRVLAGGWADKITSGIDSAVTWVLAQPR